MLIRTLWLLLLCSWLVHAMKERYLIPMITHGPNNQLGQLKHAITLARMMDRAVILPPLFEHYSDRVNDSFYEWLNLKHIIDLDQLKKETARIVTADEAKAAGWDGVVEASLLYHFSIDSRRYEVADPEFKGITARLAAALNISIPDRPLIEWKRDICEAKGMTNLANFLDLAGHRAVLVLPTIVDHWRALDGQLKATNPKHTYRPSICHESFLQVGRAFRMSSRLRLFAQDFVKESFTKDQPFTVAAHIRPYQDDCLKAWANKSGDPKDPKSRCLDVNLEELVVKKLTRVMESTPGVKKGGLFILAHPAIRWRINRLLEPQGIKPVYLDPNSAAVKALEDGIKWRHGTSSLLLLAEQSVAILAREFIGTHFSSASWIVIDERETQGNRSLPQFFLQRKQEEELQKLYKNSLAK